MGEDFVDFGPVMLDYRGGNRRVDILEFEIIIQDDNVAEPTERFEIHGFNTQNLLFPDPFMTVTILDDDGRTFLCCERRICSFSCAFSSSTLQLSHQMCSLTQYLTL